MVQLFDINNIYETPTFTLCNPDYTELAAVTAYNRKAVLRYNDVSEISFDVAEQYSDNGETKIFSYFEDIEIMRLILVENLGYFQIADVADNDDGLVNTKTVLARSLQYELASKSVDYLNGTYKFYDVVDNFDENGEPTTLMGFIMKFAKSWTIGSIDSVLFNRYRTLDISGRTVLDFIYNDVEEAYQCIFDFDFLNRIINVKSVDSLLENPYNTDIYLSFDNLVQDIEIKEQSDEIRTKLYVYGQDLDIRRVNPTGAAYIINVDYYMNTKWMEQDLIDAITMWKTKINNYMNSTMSSSYANLLTSLSERNAELNELNSTMTTLRGELSSFNNIMSVRIEQGLDYSDVLVDINAKQSQINTQQLLIDNKKAEIKIINEQLSGINGDCRIENNFTEQQLVKLDKYLIEDTYTNNNYIVTDLMTPVEIQSYAKELYDESLLVLQRISQPRYVFSLNAANFIFLEKFRQFTSQLEPGRIVNIETSKGKILNPVLLRIEYNWDDPSDFTLEFGNRFRLSDNTYTYAELVGAANKTSGQLSSNWDAIIDFSKNYKSELNDLINNAFNVALKEIISSSNQDMIWDSSGMTFRKWNELIQTYDDEQIKIINNKIVFTDDAWNSIKTVIGKIALSGGGSAYGIVAEAIVGRLLAGVNLTITNANNSFVIDENGFSFIIPDPQGDPTTVSLEDYITQEIDSFADTLGGLVDGKISSYYQDTPPYPIYINVNDNAERNAHIGDIWFNTGYESAQFSISSNKTYMYRKIDNGVNYDYIWQEIEAVPDSLYDEVDKKKTVFVSTSEVFTPLPPYSIGDLWAQNGYQDGELMVCIHERLSGNYVADDWIVSNDYNKVLNDFITNTFTPIIINMEGLIDSKINAFYQNTPPSNYIVGVINAFDNNSDFSLAMSRLGDIWYDTINKTAKRYTCVPETGDIRTFSWVVDKDVPVDLIDIIDGKKTVFVSTSENYAPTPPYSVGDLWTQREFRDGELMVCVNPKLTGESYNSFDWITSVNYSKNLNDFIENTYKPTINSKIQSFYQDTMPHIEYFNVGITDEYEAWVGDIWYDTINSKTMLYSVNANGNNYDYSWKEISAIPEDLYDMIDSKKNIFMSTSEAYRPPTPYDVGDLWVQNEYQDGKLMICVTAKDIYGQYSDLDWIEGVSYTNDASLNTFINDIYNIKIANIENQIDNVIVTFYQALPPDGYVEGTINKSDNPGFFDNLVLQIGDTWYDTINKVAKRYISNPETGDIRTFSWVIDDTIPLSVYDAIDSKKTIYFSSSESYTPQIPYYKGDLWAQGDYREGKILIAINDNTTGYDSNDWVLAETSIDKLISQIETQIDNKIASYYQENQPYGEYFNISTTDNNYSSYNANVGDIWYNTVSEQTFMYIKIKNGDNYDFVWKETDGINPVVYDIVDGKSQIFLGLSEDLFANHLPILREYDNSTLKNIDNMTLKQLTTGNTLVIINGLLDDNSSTLLLNNNYYTVCAKCNPDTTYLISKDVISNAFRIAYSTETSITPQSIVINVETHDNLSNINYTTGNNATYLYISYYTGNNEPYPHEIVYSSLHARSDKLPISPYNIGDLWVQGSTGDMLVSRVDRTKNEAFNRNDWILASKYTDDSSLTSFIDNIYTYKIKEIEGQLDGMMVSFYQPYAPNDYILGIINKTTQPSVFNDAIEKLGDLWYDTINKVAKRYTCTPETGDVRTFSWIVDNSIPLGLYDAIDGKKTVYFSTSENYRPLAPYYTGDLWAQGNYQQGNLMVCIRDNAWSFDANDWILASTSLESFIADTFIPQMDGKIKSYYQDAPPYLSYYSILDTDINYSLYNSYLGDIWYDSANQKTYMYVKVDYNGAYDYVWRETDGINSSIYDMVDGKNQVFFGLSDNLFAERFFTLYEFDNAELEMLDNELLESLDSTKDLIVFRGLLEPNNNNLVLNSDYYTACAACKPNTTYIITKELSSNVFRVAFARDEYIHSQSLVYNVQNFERETAINYTTGNDAAYLLISYYSGNNEINTERDVYSSIQARSDRFPTTPYDVGDLWVQGSTGDILVAQKSRTEDENFTTEDWLRASKYTDDTELNSFLTDIYINDIAWLELLIDSKIDTYYQDVAPDYIIGLIDKNVNEVDFTLALSRIGDIWYDIENKVAKTYSCTPKDGDSRIFSWEINNNVPTDLFDFIDGKKTVFVSTSANYTPTPPYAVGDLWAQGEYGNGELMVCKNTRLSGAYVATDWTPSNTYTATFDDFIERIYQPTIDSKITSYYNEMPYGNQINISTTDTNYNLYMARIGDVSFYNEKTWMYTKSANASIPSNFDFTWKEIEAVPDELYDTVDKKKQVFYSSNANFTPQPPYEVGDLWAQGEYRNGELMVCRTARSTGSYTASDWVASNKYFASLEDFIENTYKPSIDGKIDYFWQANQPHPEYTNIVSNTNYDVWIGDTWYNTTNNKTYIYSKTAGTISSRFNYTWNTSNLEIPQELFDELDGKKSVYQKRPNSFNVNDIWIYEGAYNASTNPNSDLRDSTSPGAGYYQSPYEQGTAYTYFKKDDLLVATSDSTTYNPSRWRKYNANITKSSTSFEFILNNDGVSISNGNLLMARGTTSRILLDPTNGIKIQKNIGSAGSPTWSDQLYADSNGNLVITGTITAIAGSIGGWTIGSTTITAPSSIVGLYGGVTSTSSSGTYQRASLISGYNTVRFWAGSSLPSAAPFAVLNDGSLYAGAASITGTINATSGNITGTLYFGGNSNFYIGGSGSYRIYMYSSSDKFFYVTNSGQLYADSATFWGMIARALTVIGIFDGAEKGFIHGNQTGMTIGSYMNISIATMSTSADIEINAGRYLYLKGANGVLINGNTVLTTANLVAQ